MLSPENEAAFLEVIDKQFDRLTTAYGDTDMSEDTFGGLCSQLHDVLMVMAGGTIPPVKGTTQASPPEAKEEADFPR